MYKIIVKGEVTKLFYSHEEFELHQIAYRLEYGIEHSIKYFKYSSNKWKEI